MTILCNILKNSLYLRINYIYIVYIYIYIKYDIETILNSYHLRLEGMKRFVDNISCLVKKNNEDFEYLKTLICTIPMHINN